MPLLKKSGIAIGQEFTKGASSILDDLGNNGNVKTALRERGTEVLKNLKKRAFDHMNGSGSTYLKQAKKRKVTQSQAISAKKQSKAAKKPTKKELSLLAAKKKSKKSKAQPVKKVSNKKQLASRNLDFFSR